MPRSTSPTVPLYLRIPVELRERLDAAASDGKGWSYKGAIADTAIKVLSAGLDQLYPLVLLPTPKTSNAQKARAQAAKRKAAR